MSLEASPEKWTRLDALLAEIHPTLKAPRWTKAILHSTDEPLFEDIMLNLLSSYLARTELPMVCLIIALIYYPSTVLGLALIILFVKDCITLACGPPHLGYVAQWLERTERSVKYNRSQHSIPIIARYFTNSTPAILLAIFGIAICPYTIGGIIVISLFIAACVELAIHLPLLTVLPMAYFHGLEMVYPWIWTGIKIVGVIIRGIYRMLSDGMDASRSWAGHQLDLHRQRKALRAYRHCMEQQHLHTLAFGIPCCSSHNLGCANPRCWPNPTGYPNRMCSFMTLPGLNYSMPVVYWGGQIAYFVNEEEARKLNLELDWMMNGGNNRWAFMTWDEIEYENFTREADERRRFELRCERENVAHHTWLH